MKIMRDDMSRHILITLRLIVGTQDDENITIIHM